MPVLGHKRGSKITLSDLLRHKGRTVSELIREGATDVILWREGRKYIGIVVSPVFAGKEEWERQNEVWGALIDNLTYEEHAQVGFVFANTPEEKAQAEREGAARG